MNLLPGEPYKKAKEKFRTLGLLAMTIEDHEAMGSTPDEYYKDKLVANPGKIMVELMNDQEVLEYLRRLLRKNPRSRNLILSVEYLRGIGRLPEEFVNFS